MSCLVDTCCGCIKLRTGSLIIGYFHLFFHVSAIVISCFAIAIGNYLEHNPNEAKQEIGAMILILCSFLLIVEISCALFTVSLLVGVHTNKRGLVKSYLINAASVLTFTFIIVLVKTALGYATPLYLVFSFCDLAVGFYFFVVIRSHHRRMEVDDLKLPAIYNTD